MLVCRTAGADIVKQVCLSPSSFLLSPFSSSHALTVSVTLFLSWRVMYNSEHKCSLCLNLGSIDLCIVSMSSVQVHLIEIYLGSRFLVVLSIYKYTVSLSLPTRPVFRSRTVLLLAHVKRHEEKYPLPLLLCPVSVLYKSISCPRI